MGTMLFDLTEDMSMSVLFKINKIVSDVTGIEGGRGMKITLDRVAIYDHISERKSDAIVERLADVFNEDMFNLLNPTYYEYEEEDE